jgi:hypothetical protein
MFLIRLYLVDRQAGMGTSRFGPAAKDDLSGFCKK